MYSTPKTVNIDSKVIEDLEQKILSKEPLTKEEINIFLDYVCYEARCKFTSDFDNFSFEFKCDKAQAIITHYLNSLNVETHPCCFVIFLRISELNTKTGHILLQPQHGLIANRETGHIYWEYKFQNKPQATRPETASETASETTSETASETTSVIEVPASFPGGEAALLSYIGQHIRYPAIAMENGIQGTVVVQFTIDEEGKASKATIIRSLIKECDQEAIRVVLSLPPFKPATKNGKPVATRYTLPLRFSMTQ